MAAENFRVKKGLEVGTATTITSEGVNVTGVITATQFKGDGSGLTGVVGSGSGVVVKDEGSAVGTAGTINFVGSGVAATLSAGTATVTVNAGGLDNVVEDTTPELGGDLNLNSKFITGSGGINVTGVVTATTLKGNGDFVDIDVDGQTEVDDLNVAGISTFNDDVTFTTANSKNIVFDKSANDLTFGDSVLARFGDSNDLSIYHDSTSSNVVDSYGALNIKSNVLTLRASDNSKYIEALNGSTTKLYFAGNQKLTTTINGIEVPDLNVTGVGTVGRLDTNGVTLGTNNNTFAAKFADDAVANFGGGNDLKIYHQNSDNNSYIKNTNGNLFFYATNTTVGLKLEPNAKVRIYHAGNAKLETDQAGVKITGVCTATSFSGSGAGLTSIPSAQLSGALPALDGSALTGITASGSGIIVKHDGSTVGTAGTINFSTNLDVSPISAGIVTVTASGGSGVSLSGSTNNTVATVTGANALIGEANLTFDGSTLAVGGSTNEKLILSGSSNPYITFKEGTTVKAYVQWHSSGYLDLVNQESLEILRIQSGSNGLKYVVDSTQNTVWHAGNDGASSGLDADLLDGQEGSYYTNATNLASGTIPNARFPATLPAVSGANLTSLNADNISSGTLATARIEDDAINADKLNNTGVSAGSYTNASITVDAQGRLTSASTGSSGITTAPSNVVLTWDVVNQGASAYRFTGPGQDPTANNPDIYLVRGNKYRFALSASGHPFQIRVSNGGSAYNDGVTNNGAQTGNVEFYVQNDAPASLVYQCTSHGGMVGNIYITGHQLTNGANNRIVTATSAYGMNGEANLTFDGSTLSVTGTTNLYGNGGASAVWGNTGYIGHLSYDGSSNAVIRAASGKALIFQTNHVNEKMRITSNGRVSINDGTRSADSATEGATLRVTGTPITRNEYFSPHGHYFGAIGYTDDTNTKAWLAVDSHYAQSSAVSAGIFLSAFHQDAGGSDCGYTIKNLKTGNALVFSRVKTAASTGNPAVEEERVRIDASGTLKLNQADSMIMTNADTSRLRLFGGSTNSVSNGAVLTLHGVNHSSGNYADLAAATGGSIRFRVGTSEKVRIDSDGHAKFQHGLTGLVGGGVIVCAASSSTGTANQSNYKVDFTVPMGELGTNHETADIQNQFGSGETGKNYSHSLGGSGLLIATVQNNYYWGYRSKIYHIITYGNASNNETQLYLMENRNAAGHGSNNAAVDLAVQSHNGKTPTIRATFSGDFWNSNVLTVTFIGSSVASTGNIRSQLTTFDSSLTGQDPNWK